MKAGLATELLQPCHFAADRQQPPSPECLCIFGGEVSLADLPAGVNVGILHALMIFSWSARPARKRYRRKNKMLCTVYMCVSLLI